MSSNTSYNIQMSIDEFYDNVIICRYIDEDFIIVDLNKHTEKTENISKADLVGHKLSEIFPTDKELELFDRLVKVQREEIPQELDITLNEDNHIHGWRSNSIRKLHNGDIVLFYRNNSDYKRLEMQIEQNKKALDEAQRVARIGDWKWDMVTNKITWSDEVYRIFGEEPQSFEPTFEKFMSYLPDEEKVTLNELITRSIENNEPYNVGHHVLRHDKKYCYVNGSGQALFNEKKEPIAMVGKVFDITERKKEMLQHKETEAELKLLGQAIEQTDEIIRITDKDGVITYVNDALVAHTGYRKVDLIGKNMSIFQSGKMDSEFYQKMWNTISSGKTYRGVMINKKRDNTIYYEEQTITPIYDDTNQIEHYISTSQDITKRIEMEEQLKLLATTDGLTGIYNRRKISEEIDMQMTRSKRYNEPFALLMFDFDLFKEVNDSYGHDIGDYVLVETCKLISQYIREGDSFGRWGGEEFMLIFPNLDEEKAVRIAEKLRDLIANFSFKKASNITISFGVSTYNKNENIKTLLKRVDDALYQAKNSGRNKVVFK